jgi:UDP-N-acetylenolpyruvoylglucosamine reductase
VRLEENVPLARLTTIGTGGPARYLARPRSVAELREAFARAAAAGLPVEVIGLGSNVLAADRGVEAVVVRLEGALAEARAAGTVLVAGGGATNAVCLHRARAAGLGGLEFASAIPGTVGGGVRMNAGAYGVEFRDVLLDATVVDAAGEATLGPDELDLAYRRSSLRDGQVVVRVRLQLHRRDRDAIKAEVAALAARRKATQPTTRRTFGSVWKNPPGDSAGRLIEACGLKGARAGGAVISARHANFIENGGGATSADCLALMVEARRRVYELFGIVLEHEVRFLGPLALPPLGPAG